MPIPNITSEHLEQAIAVGRTALKNAGSGWTLPWYNLIDRLVLAVSIVTDRDERTAGATDFRFTLMSVVKPFLLLRQLQLRGLDVVTQWVDNKPSDLPFYSLEQLLADGGRPRNAMLNSGAMLLTDRLPGDSAAAQYEGFLDWLNQLTGCQFDLCYEGYDDMLSDLEESVNWELALALQSAGQTSNASQMLDAYFRICCLSGDIRDAARLARVLSFGHPEIPSEHLAHVHQAMRTCGLYEETLDWDQRYGIPTKSGVSGLVIACVPQQFGLAAVSPWLKPGGNSEAALTMMAHLLEQR